MRQTEFDISRLLPPTSQIRALCFLLSVLYFSQMLDWQTTAALVLSVLALSGYTAWLLLRRMVNRLHRQLAVLERLRRDNRELEAHLKTDRLMILDTLGVPFLLVRRSGRLILANVAAGELLGVNTELHPNLLWVLEESALHSMLEQAVRCTEPHTFELRHRLRGEDRLFRVTATPLDHAERPIGIVFHDVTEAQRAQTIRRDFVANASHELRSPLTLIRGYVETLLDSPEVAADAAERTHALTIMKKHADRVVQLVEDMLTLTRLENSDRLALHIEEFSLQTLAEDIFLRLEPLTKLHQAELITDIEEKTFLLQGDRFYWSQILFNLTENALKNNPQGGVRVTLRARRTSDACTIEVEDNGIGIAEEALPFIFNRFYRADRTGRIKGTGLGLAIVRHAVEAHGGTVKAESTPRDRTTFLITLPRR